MTPQGPRANRDPSSKRVGVWLVLAVVVAAAVLLAADSPQAAAREPHPSCRWTFLGPRAVVRGEGYDGSRVPVTGRVTALAVDAVDSERVYLGSALAGVWRSLDGGATWQPVGTGVGSPAVGALAADPLRPGRVYAGTGEANLAFRQWVVSGDRPLLGDRGAGLLKSDDGGETWELRGVEEFTGAAFAELAVSPHHPEHLLAATTRGLFRSRDEGRSWQRLEEGLPEEPPEGMATSVAFHPGDPRVAYAAFWARGVFRTTDLDSDRPHWRALEEGFPRSSLSRIGLATSAASPDELYVYAADADSRLSGLFRSADRGSSFSRLEAAPDLLSGQGFFNLLIAAHPRSPRVLFLGGAGDRRLHASSLYRASQIGTEWRFAPIGRSLHVDFHALAFDPKNEATLYVANDGGVWRSDNGGGDWRALNVGLPIVQFNRIDQHPRSGAFLVGGTQDNGTLFYLGDGVWDHGDDGDGGFVAIDPERPEVVYNEFSLYKIARSERAGRYGTFKPVFPELKGIRSVFYAPFVLCQQRSEVIALGLDRLYLSEDRGQSWTAVSIDLSRGWTNRLESNALSALLFPTAERIFAGTSDGKVWRLDRVLGRWVPFLLHTPPGAERGAYVTDLALDPLDPRRLFVTFFGGPEASLVELLQEENGTVRERALVGRSGKRLPPGGGLAIEVDPGHPSVLYWSGEEGLMRSLDRGESWSPFASGLPSTPVADLDLHPSLPLLRAATHGWGVWEIDLSGEPCPPVEAYLRDSEWDQGRSGASSWSPAPEDGAAPDSPDIAVVPAAKSPGTPVDAVRFFSELESASPIAGEDSQIFVHVASRGPSSTDEVSLLVYLASGPTPPRVELGAATPGAAWGLLGRRQLRGLGPLTPQVASFPWPVDRVAQGRFHLLAVVEEGGRPWPAELGLSGDMAGGAAAGAGRSAEELARAYRQMALETVTVRPAGPPPTAAGLCPSCRLAAE